MLIAVVVCSDKSGVTPAHLAAYLDKPEALAFLIEQSTVQNALDAHGIPPSPNRYSFALLSASTIVLHCTIDWLIVCNGFLDATGHTPLHYACLQGHFECVGSLLGENVQWQNAKEHAFGPLHCAAYACLLQGVFSLFFWLLTRPYC